MAYVIKRYSNRKLYDTQESRYVTLEEIEEMIRAGREIAVVDAASGEDLTSVTLAQIILENAYAPSRSGSRSGRTRRSSLVLVVDVLHRRDDGRARFLNALAGLLRRRLKPLGRAGERLGVTFEKLERLLDTVHPLRQRLLINVHRVLRAVGPGCLPAPGCSLGVAQHLDDALLKLGVEPHAFLRRGRGELHELSQHALVGVCPHRHCLDRFAGKLTEQLLSLRLIVH